MDGILIYFSDITTRKEAEIREQMVAARLSQVMDVTSDAIFSVDRDWRFLLLNRRASELNRSDWPAAGEGALG